MLKIGGYQKFKVTVLSYACFCLGIMGCPANLWFAGEAYWENIHTSMGDQYIIKSTTASECITALGRMHIGRQITIPLSVLFRFIPTMQEESAAIKDAMRMREVQFGTKKFWQNPADLIEYRYIPLMISVVKIGDDLSAAALTRGLDNPVRRTNITKVGFTAWDLLAVLIAGTALLSTYFFSPW